MMVQPVGPWVYFAEGSHAMKKLLAAALCSVITLFAWSSQASAGIFNCGCCNKCGTFCVRPYNAFSPVCYGTVTCAGVNPLCSPGYGPNLAFHGSMCGPHSAYAAGMFPVMAPPMMHPGMGYPGMHPQMMPLGPDGMQRQPEMLPNPKPETKPEEKKNPDGKEEGATSTVQNPPMNPGMNPYAMTPWGVPVWAMSNPYANPYMNRMPPQMPYGQMMPPVNPYGQMPPQMPYGQMPPQMPNYNYNPGYMPNMMHPGMMNPNMPAPSAMPPMMPNAR